LPKNHLRNGIWKNTGEIMINKGILPPFESKNIFEWFCFYNYFQRPAEEEGKGLIINIQDIRQAN